MAEIQGGRWERLLQKVWTLKGPVAPNLSSEILPTTLVQPFESEHYLPLRDRLVVCAASQGALAANYSYCVLNNDSTDHLVIVESIRCFTQSGGTVFQARNDAAGLGGLAAVMGLRDTRMGLTRVAGGLAGAVRANTAGALGGNAVGFSVSSAANINVDWPHLCPYVLAPQTALAIWNVTMNQSVYVTFRWREHLMEPGETTA